MTHASRALNLAEFGVSQSQGGWQQLINRPASGSMKFPIVILVQPQSVLALMTPWSDLYRWIASATRCPKVRP